jgi:DNA polymerase III delta subunit
MEKAGFQPDYILASNKEIFRSSLCNSSVFLSSPTLVVADATKGVDVDLVAEHYKSQTTTFLVLYYEGNPRAGSDFAKLAKKLPAGRHWNFRLESKFKRAGAAADFAIKEAKESYGKTLPYSLAQALVTRVGEDHGVLYYEIKKVCFFADGEEITPKHLSQTMAQVAEAAVFPVVDALSSKDHKKLLRVLSRIRTTHRIDPTMKVCGLLRKTVLKWLCAANLSSKGLSIKDSAEITGDNLWYFQNKIIPVSRLWGQRNLIKLIDALAKSERGVLRGELDPWTAFTCRLSRVLLEASG